MTGWCWIPLDVVYWWFGIYWRHQRPAVNAMRQAFTIIAMNMGEKIAVLFNADSRQLHGQTTSWTKLQ